MEQIRRDITQEAEETSSVQLSHSLRTLSEEIQAYRAVVKGHPVISGQAIFEIGRRLRWAKQRLLVHGEFGQWLEAINMDRSVACRYMKIVAELGDLNFGIEGSYISLGEDALYLIANLPRVERNRVHLVHGVLKQPSCMTIRELRALKKTLD